MKPLPQETIAQHQQQQQQQTPVQVKAGEIPPHVRLLAAPLCCTVLGLLLSPKFLVLALVYALVSARPLLALLTRRLAAKKQNNDFQQHYFDPKQVETALRIHADLTLQFSIMAACLWLYEHSRLLCSPAKKNSSGDDTTTTTLVVHQAFDMAKRLVLWEHAVGLAIEPSWQGLLWNHAHWLILVANAYYAVFHFVVPLGIMARLIVQHKDPRWEHRAGFFIMLVLALLLFAWVPTMPPRLMPSYKLEYIDTQQIPTPLTDQEARVLEPWWNIIDTMKQGDTLYDKLHKEGGNPYAAMPSMHTGWALWSCLTWLDTIGTNASDRSRRLQRSMAVGHVVCMVVVIILTGNHFWLDAVAGAICVLIGRVMARRLIESMWSHNGIVSRVSQRCRHTSYWAALVRVYSQTFSSSRNPNSTSKSKWRNEDDYDEEELTSSLTTSVSISSSSSEGTLSIRVV